MNDQDTSMDFFQFETDYARFGYMKRRIFALEREQSILGKRVDALEARLRAENTEPIPGDIGLPVDEFVIRYGAAGLRAYRMLPPEMGDEHR